jgi:hypothetical protein
LLQVVEDQGSGVVSMASQSDDALPTTNFFLIVAGEKKGPSVPAEGPELCSFAES